VTNIGPIDNFLRFSDQFEIFGAESKEFKVMVMVDIFWYLTLVVGSELPLLVKQSIHNCTWIEHGSGPGIAYYRFNNLTRLKYC
jgi:hypothetical protein